MVGMAPYSIKLQSSGNFVMLDATGNQIWQTNSTNMGTAPYRLIVQNNGVIHILDSMNVEVYAMYPQRCFSNINGSYCGSVMRSRGGVAKLVLNTNGTL